MPDDLINRRTKFKYVPKPATFENLPPMFKAYIKRQGPLAIEKLQSALRVAKKGLGKVSGAALKAVGPISTLAPDISVERGREIKERFKKAGKA